MANSALVLLTTSVSIRLLNISDRVTCFFFFVCHNKKARAQTVLRVFTASAESTMCASLLAGIQQLQLILLKVALIVAVEFHINVEFVKLLEPLEDQEKEGIVLPHVLYAPQSNEPADDPQAFGKAIGVKEQI